MIFYWLKCITIWNFFVCINIDIILELENIGIADGFFSLLVPQFRQLVKITTPQSPVWKLGKNSGAHRYFLSRTKLQ